MAYKHNDPCLAKAGDEEPIFVLLARDPSAPALVKLWAAIRAGDFSNAQALLETAWRANLVREPQPDDFGQLQEAIEWSRVMHQWRMKNWRQRPPPRPDKEPSNV